MKLPLAALVLVCIAVVEPWIHRSRAQVTVAAEAFTGWSSAPLPGEVTSVALSPREAEFARDFPGQIGVFADGPRLWIVRWVHKPTRKLHPSSDCLRAAGYAIEPTSAYADPDGALWSVFIAKRGHERLRCRERISACGDSREGWSDVSAWYWHAILGKAVGPWWAVTVVEPDGGG